MPSYPRGLYESLLTERLAEELGKLGSKQEAQRQSLRAPEAADRIALHIERAVRRAVGSLKDKERVAKGVALARQLIEGIVSITDTAAALDLPLEPAEVLRAIVDRRPDGSL